MIQHTRLFNSLVRQKTAKSLAELKCIMNLDWLEQKDYIIVNTPELFEWALRHIAAASLLGVDTETTGLNIYNLSDDNPIKDHIVGMSISWERNQGIYIPFEHVLFENLDKRYALTRLKPYLESKSIITHNGLFDGKVFYDEGIQLHITQDTLLMHFNIDSTVSKGSKGLKAITTRRYGYEVIELGDIFEKESDAGLFKYVEYELVKAYACADSDHTLMIFLDAFPELLPGQLNSYRLDIRVQNALIRSEFMGKGIDMKLLRDLNDINNLDMQVIEDLIYKYVGMTLAGRHGTQGQLSAENMYRFNIASSQELAYVLFDLLKCEIPESLKDSEKISVDKHTLKALIDNVDSSEDEILDILVPKDIESAIKDYRFYWASKKENILVERDEMAGRKYKVAVLIKKYRKLEKLRSSFFTPLLSNNYEGKYFSGIKMTRAETARLVDTIQTLDKYLKRLIIPLNLEHKKQYILDFDFAQIEYRAMGGQAGVTHIVERLQNSEADYHREGGSLILGKSPEDITGDERSSLKSVNFGIPYGMSKYGILQDRYGIGLSEEDKEIKLAEIEEMLVKWDKGLHPIRVMLDDYRLKAITPVADETLPPHLRGQRIGRISNLLGRTRLFKLDNTSKQKLSSIKRQAGNYPIQSFAREVFCNAFCDFSDACVASGLMDIRVPDKTKSTGYRFENKVSVMGLIHDECLISVDGDVNHEFLYKLVYDNCMIQLEGFPRFYCGINIIDNWYEGKDDTFEAPVGYVEQVISKKKLPIFCASGINHKQIALAGITEYMIQRIKRELVEIDKRVAEGFFDMPLLVDRFKNYFVKPKIASYIGLHRKVDKNAHFDDFAVDSIESYALYMFETSYVRALDGSEYVLKRNAPKYTPAVDTSYYKVPRESDEYAEWQELVEESPEQDDTPDTEEHSESNKLEISEKTISQLAEAYQQPDNLGWSFKDD
ncbi:MAG: DNA polymerase [Clostridia bacterium]